MSKNQLKTLVMAQDAEAAPLSAAGRADINMLRRVAVDAGRTVPPAVVRPPRRTVLINVKVDEALAIALARRAEAEGLTQKQIIMRALLAAGLPVDPLDLEDRTPRRRTAA
jgi:hypothetical protein